MKYSKVRLDNGLTVIHEKRDVSVTTVMLAVRYGAAYESAEEKGIAHFLEHMCFKGTEKRDVKQIAEEIENVGGDLNAFTSEEVTAYHVKLPSEHLELAMDVLFDVFFNPSFPEETVEKEANVIIEEIKMYRDNPKAHVFDMIKCCMYKAPFGMFIGGTEETVKRINRLKLAEKHRKVYVPVNSFLCVVGNNNLKDVVKFAEKFSPKVSGEFSDKTKIEAQLCNEEEHRAGINQTNLALGFYFPKLNEMDRYAAEVFSTILGQGMSSKLFTEVREKRGLVYGIKTDLDMGKDYSYLIIWAGTDPSKKDEVINLCLEEYRKMRSITQRELDNAKLQVIGSRKVESEGSDHTALDLVMEEIGGESQDYYLFEQNINKVTLDDIKRISEKIEYGSFVLGP